MKVRNVGIDHGYAIVRGWVGQLGASASIGSVTDSATGTTVGGVDELVFPGQDLVDEGPAGLYVMMQADVANYANTSGIGLAPGNVLVIDSTTDNAVTTTTTAHDTRLVCIAVDYISIGGSGPIQIGGRATVTFTGPVSRGQYACTSTTAGQATSDAARQSGSFGFIESDSDANNQATVAMFGTTDSSSSTPGGVAGGDLSGSYPNPSVVAVNGIAVQNWTGSLSSPPTEAEVEAILGPPTATVGQTFVVSDTGTGSYHYCIGSDGAGYFVIPTVRLAGTVGPTVYTLTTAPEGGWSWFEEPRAVSSGAYTYVGYNQGGNLKVAVIHAGAVVNTITVHSALEYDDHDTPALCVRASDGKLYAFYSKHGGTDIYERISVNTVASDFTLSGGFGSETSLSATFGSSNATYPSPVYVPAVDGGGEQLFLFWREIVSSDGQWWYDSHDGSSWFGAAAHLHTIDYAKAVVNGTTRIDMACSDHPDDGAQHIYHLYREASHWHKSDGTNLGSLPYGPSDLTTVYTASGTDTVWMSDIAIDASNHPIIAFVRWPSDDTSDARAMYARWTGSAWSVTEIVAMGGYIPDTDYPPGNPQAHYHGGLSLDQTDPTIVYISREISGQWEMFKYVTADGGSTFTPTQITTGSTAKQVRPATVRDHTATSGVAMAWLYGTYHDYVNYSLGIKGLAA